MPREFQEQTVSFFFVDFLRFNSYPERIHSKIKGFPRIVSTFLICFPFSLFYWQIHKKRRIVGRVSCRSIKSECPKPTCPDPVLLPGRCCKVCPGQTNSEYCFVNSLSREKPRRGNIPCGFPFGATATIVFWPPPPFLKFPER